MADSKTPQNIIRRDKKMRALGASIDKLTRQSFGQRGLTDGKIIHHWPEIIGEMMAVGSLPEKITYTKGQRGRGTLHLRVSNSGLATEIQHLEPMILERVNTYFGYQAVARLKLNHGPLPEPEPERSPAVRPLNEDQKSSLAEDLAIIKDPELKTALDGLGKAVIGRGNKQNE
jgi:hypothetical protein